MSADLAALDLNLLVVLDALLDTRSVTAAAARLGRTQPAVSQSLARLRDMLDDPLLVRTGRGMVPTARGAALAPEVRRVMGEVRALLTRDAGFDPAISTRTFRLACPDLLAPFLPSVVAVLRGQAPGVGLSVEGPLREPLVDVLTEPDAPLALLALPVEGAGLRVRRFGVVTWGLAVRADHPLVADPTGWLSWPHLVVRTGSGSRNRVADALAAAGLDRRVGLVVPSFLMAPDILAATDLVHLAPRELVAPLARRAGLAIVPLPMSLPPLAVGAAWHERHHADAGHRWFRERVAAVLGGVLGAASEEGGG